MKFLKTEKFCIYKSISYSEKVDSDKWFWLCYLNLFFVQRNFHTCLITSCHRHVKIHSIFYIFSVKEGLNCVWSVSQFVRYWESCSNESLSVSDRQFNKTIFSRKQMCCWWLITDRHWGILFKEIFTKILQNYFDVKIFWLIHSKIFHQALNRQLDTDQLRREDNCISKS